ncbi:hypothetical protein D9756_007609 [Leucocoprinus leucothites]|uniref:Uncharacterized protein n=1 Tax=Leucocoprinus leucothites TaxID=201217 RepID=A0A8H5D3D4_9AGAR|nr:hypothetical protein D9756_007609 [Leucoagaricus leucothites]
MAGTGFGLPSRLLNIPSVSSGSPLSTSAPVLPVPPAPSFADFKFQKIGQQPRLLTRFTEPSQVQDSVEDDSMSVSSESDQRSQSTEQNAMLRTRPSLWQALAEQDTAFATNPPISDNRIGQTSAGPSRFPVVETSVTDDQQANTAKVSQPDRTSSNFSRSISPSHTASQFSVPAPSPRFDASSDHHNTGDSMVSMHLGYPSASPGPSGANGQAMEGVQPSHTPDRQSLPPFSRKYETLRQIHSQLQASIPSHNQPNLASAILLASSAQQKATTVHAETRKLYICAQDIMQVAQKTLAITTTLLRGAEEAKGLADGAKSEIERISSAYADQQRQSDHNEFSGLLQSLGSWIASQEADEATLRARRAQQLKLKKQQSDLVRAPAKPSSNPPLGAPPIPGPTTTTTPPASASVVLRRQPLFYSPTPEVDIKVEPRTWSQPPLQPPPVSTASVSDPNRRQAELRKLLKEKHRLSDEELSALSPLEAARERQRRLEEEEQRQLEDEKHKQLQEVEEKRKEQERRLAEERRQQEEERQKELARQEEQKRKREESERKLLEEAERKAREEREKHEEEKRARADAEKRAHEAFEAEKKKALEEAERKAREVEAQRKAQVEEEAKKKAQEEAERKAREEAARRKTQEEAQRERLLIQQKQEEELQARLAEEAELRRAQEKAREKQKLEEQAQFKAEQERQEKLRQDQIKQRAQIQADKDKTMADLAQQIRAQRSHRLQPSLDGTSEMSLDSSPVVSSLISLPRGHLSAGHDPSTLSPASRTSLTQAPPLAQHLPQQPQVNGLVPGSTIPNQGDLSGPQPSTALDRPSSTLAPPQANNSSSRSMSLPPVAHLSQSDRSPSTTPIIPPTQRTPTLSVYRLSGDSGNVPYRENNPNLSSPQAQAANIRHVVSALNLPPPTAIKTEPQEESRLLYPPSRDPTPVQPSASQAVPKPTVSSSASQRPSATPIPVSAGQHSPSLSAQPANGSHPHTILDRRIPSSPATIAIPRSHTPNSQQSQQPQQTAQASIDIPTRPQVQVPSRPASASGTLPRPNRDNHPASRNEGQQELLPGRPSSSQINDRSRSSSPFRMGPDAYVAPQLVKDSSPPDTTVEGRAPPTGTVAFRGRLPPSTSAPPSHWDHYSPSPQRPLRQTDTYRPNYSERSRTPPAQAGRKRSRENTPPPPPYPRDYRDFDDRRAPLRPRTPPRRPSKRRTPSRSRSPTPPPSRPTLATRLRQGPPPPGENSYRSITPPRDWERDREPHLLSRFSDTRLAGPPPTKPGRPRGKRGRGGGVGPPSGPSHASLEQRISSGSTLATRIQEDPRRP